MSPKHCYGTGFQSHSHSNLCCSEPCQSAVQCQWLPQGAFSPSFPAKRRTCNSSPLDYIFKWFRQNLSGKVELNSSLIQDRPDVKLVVGNTYAQQTFTLILSERFGGLLCETEPTVSLHSYFIHPESLYCAHNWQILAVHKMLCNLSDVQKKKTKIKHLKSTFATYPSITAEKLRHLPSGDNMPEGTLPRVVSFKSDSLRYTVFL